ncbi:MAG: hypothetical protein GY807_24320 [Gammaproteobacteria bacterium]|nr:hypothetical protein [Gammaproteobacteria bacterium]
MSPLPAQSLQSIAAGMAQAMLENDDARIRALCRSLADELPGSADPAPEPEDDDASAADEQRLGIWSRDADGAPFRRLNQYRPEWRMWADVDEIPGESAGRRIILLGESAARGYLYDPTFAPAAVLQRLLHSVPATRDVEVVDLARSSIGPAGVVQLAAESRRLRPDLFVVVAGNNWCGSLSYGASTRVELIEGLIERGYRGFIDAIEAWQVSRTQTTAERLAGIADRLGIPVILVVPETNLNDWREDQNPIVPLLAGGGTGRWFDLAYRARAALDNGELADAERLASELIALDNGTSPVGHSICGHCHMRRGDVDTARRLFEVARDVARALPIDTSPGCSRAIQDGLRGAGEAHGFHVVDLPSLMQDALGGALPDRRMFLDYCHLTSAGIRLMTDAVARISVRLLGDGDPGDLAAATATLGPGPEVDADAHFMAAIHCARWRQSGELPAFHLAEAVRLSPAIATRMRAYLQCFARSGPAWLDRFFPALIGRPGSPTHRFFCEISPFVDTDIRDETLFAAIADTVNDLVPSGSANAGPSTPAGSNGTAGVDLISREHAAPNQVSSLFYATMRRSFFEANEPETGFVFTLGKAERLDLEITYRTRDAEAGGDIVLRLNDRQIGVFPAAAKWATATLDDLALDRGRNELAVTWPPVSGDIDSRIGQSVAQLRRNTLPNPLNAFGQIHRLRLTPAR